MKITKAELIELKACKEGLARFISQTNNTDEPVEVSSLIGGENTYDDLLWLAGKKLQEERIVRFTCDCALLNVELIKPYTAYYDFIVEFLRNPDVGYACTSAYINVARAAVHFTSDAIDADAAANDATRYAAHAVYYAILAITYMGNTGVNAYHKVNVCAASAANSAANPREKVEKLLKELFA